MVRVRRGGSRTCDNAAASVGAEENVYNIYRQPRCGADPSPRRGASSDPQPAIFKSRGSETAKKRDPRTPSGQTFPGARPPFFKKIYIFHFIASLLSEPDDF